MDTFAISFPVKQQQKQHWQHTNENKMAVLELKEREDEDSKKAPIHFHELSRSVSSGAYYFKTNTQWRWNRGLLYANLWRLWHLFPDHDGPTSTRCALVRGDSASLLISYHGRYSSLNSLYSWNLLVGHSTIVISATISKLLLITTILGDLRLIFEKALGWLTGICSRSLLGPPTSPVIQVTHRHFQLGVTIFIICYTDLPVDSGSSLCFGNTRTSPSEDL